MESSQRRRRVEPTDEWEQVALLCRWPEQLAYEEIRPLTLFGASVARSAGSRAAGSARRCHEASEPAEVFGLDAHSDPGCRMLPRPFQDEVAELPVDLDARGGAEELS